MVLLFGKQVGFLVLVESKIVGMALVGLVFELVSSAVATFLE